MAFNKGRIISDRQLSETVVALIRDFVVNVQWSELDLLQDNSKYAAFLQGLYSTRGSPTSFALLDLCGPKGDRETYFCTLMEVATMTSCGKFMDAVYQRGLYFSGIGDGAAATGPSYLSGESCLRSSRSSASTLY